MELVVMADKIKVGVFGAGRGEHLVASAGVNGLIVSHDYDDVNNGVGSIKIDDCMSILMCTMDNGAARVVFLLGAPPSRRQ